MTSGFGLGEFGQTMLNNAENARRNLTFRLSPERKASFGQYMTPSSVACFMVSLFPSCTAKACRLLDAGAGVGALSCAFLDYWLTRNRPFDSFEVNAYEIDDNLRSHLEERLAVYRDVTVRIFAGDYIDLATARCHQDCGYTHVILNPPYKKISNKSAHRLALRSVGIETVNLYSAFVALAVTQCAPGGQIVAIIPRSFCNGPYYRPFRDFIAKRAALRHMHLFASRSKAFKDDDVLQENIIVRLERGAQQGPVTVSTSTDDTFSDLASHEYPFERIVFPDDPERFIHVPTSPEKNALELSPAVRSSLEDIGIKVSTGPVVDFRLKEHLRAVPEGNTVPLLYPGHFCGGGTKWPIKGAKKPNAIVRDAQSEKWLYPNGYYCVVRRFSSKEEHRRIVASVVEPSAFGNASALGFENHLNVFHANKRGLPKELAHGLAVYLGTTAVDENFRRFNGHTQVNATDLKLMRYPSREALIQLGEWAMQQERPSQDQIDAKLGTLTV